MAENQLGRIGQNGAEEFASVLTYQVAFPYAREIIQGATAGIENEAVKEALNDSLNVVAFGLIFHLINKEQKIIEKIFNRASVAVGALVLAGSKASKNALDKWKQKYRSGGVRGRGGTIARMVMGTASAVSADRFKMAQIVTDVAVGSARAGSNQYDAIRLSQHRTQVQDSLVSRDAHTMQLAQNKLENQFKGTLINLITGNIKAHDVSIIQRITGDSAITMDNLQRFSEAIFAKDSSGNVVGLSQSFLSMVNALGYLHNPNQGA